MAKRRRERRPVAQRARGRDPSPGLEFEADPKLGFEPLHLGLLLGGVAVAVLGYVLLDRGSISLAPVLLVVAYLILVPVALALPARGRDGDEGA